jgi:hypothetical protein
MVLAMESFASSSTKCRRAWLLDYLGEPFDAANCQGCDVCDRRRHGASVAAAAASGGGSGGSSGWFSTVPASPGCSGHSGGEPAWAVQDLTAPAKLLVGAVANTGGRFGISVPVALVRQDPSA